MLRSLTFFRFATLAILLTASITNLFGQESTIVDDWRYVLQNPGEGWQSTQFDDTRWNIGKGGFGTRETPAARIGTTWRGKQIWLRKTFDFKTSIARPAIFIHHDEDAEVFLNGKLIGAFKEWSTDYQVVPLTDQQRSSLRDGNNLLAVHCRQSTGGQFIDVHIIDADDVPVLPVAPREQTPQKTELITQWGESLTAGNAWTEYPRPQLVRKEWTNLNGLWDYAITSATNQERPIKWDGEILVPFSLESKLGGVERLLNADETLWYHRTFSIDSKDEKHWKLNFEAVDYQSKIFVNGVLVGTHVGGNDPFSIDISDSLINGENELVVRVKDETEKWQLNGKQSLNPEGIWYTQSSGIWQTVWLEPLPKNSIEDLHLATDATNGSISIEAICSQPEQTAQYRVVVRDGDQVVTQLQSPTSKLRVQVPSAKLWSPSEPTLYDLEVSLLNESGEIVDQVQSYAGIRTVGKARDEAGHLRFTLNGQTIFHWGPLDQGWWPDGLLTPPSDQAMLYDIEFLKTAGFNMIRKHIKVEPRRYYYHCDRLGMMVWQDQVSGGERPKWTRLDPNPNDAKWPVEADQQFMLEFERMVDNLENHPSIVVWTPFNEAWGQHRTVEVGQWIAARDPSRLVNVASGGNFWPVGDVVDQHSYPDPDFPFDPKRYEPFIKVVGEFGGHGYPVPGHLWDANRRNWGYGGLPENESEYRQRYRVSLEKLNALRKQGIAAGVYTQTTDVEGEINGLMTYDRRVTKIPVDELAKLHQQLFD